MKDCEVSAILGFLSILYRRLEVMQLIQLPVSTRANVTTCDLGKVMRTTLLLLKLTLTKFCWESTDNDVMLRGSLNSLNPPQILRCLSLRVDRLLPRRSLVSVVC